MVVKEVDAMKERKYTRYKSMCGLRMRLSYGNRERYMIMVMFLN